MLWWDTLPCLENAGRVEREILARAPASLTAALVKLQGVQVLTCWMYFLFNFQTDAF